MKQKQRKSTKTLTSRELEKKLDKIFSIYIRLRDADSNGYCWCITCGRTHYWSDGHQVNCGHFIPRGRKAVRFDERNCHAQCVHCNKWLNGAWDIYEQRMIEMYGKEEVEKLKEKSRIGGSYSGYQLAEMITEYNEKVKALKLEKGL